MCSNPTGENVRIDCSFTNCAVTVWRWLHYSTFVCIERNNPTVSPPNFPYLVYEYALRIYKWAVASWSSKLPSRLEGAIWREPSLERSRCPAIVTRYACAKACCLAQAFANAKFLPYRLSCLRLVLQNHLRKALQNDTGLQ